MENIQVLNGDSFELIKSLPDNSVDLVVTSPPYADIVSYGKNITTKTPNEYVDWLLPLFVEIYRVLKPTGSFILNINDNCKNSLRNFFVYELIYRSQKETPLRFYDMYIWHKKNGIPNGQKKRFRNNTEFLFHFVKNQKQLKFYMDRVMLPPKESYKNRFDGDTTLDLGQGVTVDGVRVKKPKTMKYTTGYTNKSREGYEKPDYVRTLPELIRPDNVFRFSNAGANRDNLIKHPAPFHKELPKYFINLLTDEGDVVLDVFSGIGTTGLPCIELNRKFIGFELNQTYCDFSKERLGIK